MGPEKHAWAIQVIGDGTCILRSEEWYAGRMRCSPPSMICWTVNVQGELAPTLHTTAGNGNLVDAGTVQWMKSRMIVASVGLCQS